MNQAALSLPTVTGVLEEKHEDRIVLDVLETDYHLHLAVDRPMEAEVGGRVSGVIHCQSRRVDRIPAGGWYVEPVYGRPRRAQGRIIGGDVASNTIWVKVGYGLPIVATLMAGQKTADFYMGEMVAFDVERGARFELTEVD